MSTVVIIQPALGSPVMIDANVRGTITGMFLNVTGGTLLVNKGAGAGTEHPTAGTIRDCLFSDDVTGGLKQFIPLNIPIVPSDVLKVDGAATGSVHFYVEGKAEGA